MGADSKCGEIFKMRLPEVSYCIRPSPHLRTMSADCPGTDRIHCFVSTPTGRVQSTNPYHVVKLQLGCVRVAHF